MVFLSPNIWSSRENFCFVSGGITNACVSTIGFIRAMKLDQKDWYPRRLNNSKMFSNTLRLRKRILFADLWLLLIALQIYFSEWYFTSSQQYNRTRRSLIVIYYMYNPLDITCSILQGCSLLSIRFLLAMENFENYSRTLSKMSDLS